MSEATHEWRLPEADKPPLVSELVERIDEAVAIARASEAAVMTVGAAALDAAEQARRAADLAERASTGMSGGAADSVGSADGRPMRLVTEDDQLRDFATRADRVAERLRALAG
ncbi:MAG TPA: hypothetical protein VHF50_05795 [Solirubrobacterales bacterium]|nr:hypothetical protein [Solirubrobacterales bacterium]